MYSLFYTRLENFLRLLGIVNEFQTCKDQVQSCKTCRGVSNSEHLGH